VIADYVTLANVLAVAAALAVLALLRLVWHSEQARRAIERDRNAHLVSEREVARAHQRDRGD